MEDKKPRIFEVEELIEGREVLLWGDTNYKVSFNKLTNELIYRIKIPVERLKEAGL